MQPDLFHSAGEDVPHAAGLFADIVFDRPLDHAFTYAVGDELRAKIGVGKRVRAPFGRGDKATVGYCVRLNDTAPPPAVKELIDVLDDEALLTDNLLRLTRWMADYYLCGWRQLLHAVAPAGARHRAATRKLVFIEAVPDAEWPTPTPELTAKQTTALQQLRNLGRPVEMRQVGRLARCGPGPVEALVTKGVARRVARRIEQFADTSEEAAPDGPIVLNPDQEQVWKQVEPALLSGGFNAFLLHGVTGSGKTEIYLRAI